jgi:hypothetical protein
MNWKNTKHPKLAGYTLDTTMVNNELREIVFVGPDGPVLRVAIYTYNMNASIPEPPKTVEKFAVTGTALDVPIKKTFDHKHEAEAYKDAVTRSTTFGLPEPDVKVEAVQVPEDESIPF